MLGSSIGKNSLLLATFAMVTAGVLATTYQLTRDKINQSERAAAQRALFEIVPRESHTNNLLEDTIAVPSDAREQLGIDAGEIHLARQGEKVIAAIVPGVAPDGYSGDIRMLVGVNRDGTVSGVRVLSHRETPGLGDKVELKKSDWILGFAGKSLGQPPAERWRVKKDGGDFDQFTGATITPRAVVNQVRNVLEFVRQNRSLLFPTSVETEPAEPSPENGSQNFSGQNTDQADVL